MPSFEQRFKIREPSTILKSEDKRKIHRSALEVLERTGIRMHSAFARKELKRAGAVVDEQSKVVRFPGDVVAALTRSVPSVITLAARDKEYDLPVDGTHHYYTTDGCGIYVWDERTKTRRPSKLEDIRKSAVIGDWLPYLSIYEPMVVANDVPANLHVVMGMKEAIENTSKHILTESTTNAAEAKAQIRMASAWICVICGQTVD